MPKISVVTPVYNAEKYIRKSIDSILNQTFVDFEFIIVDDGSTDSTKDLVASYGDSRIKFITNAVNKGSVDCLSQAISLASTEYIATQDADDISFPNRLEKQYAFLEANPHIFCLGGWAKKIDENNNEIGVWQFPPQEHRDILEMLVKQRKCPIINPTSIFRKIDYNDLGGYSNNSAVRASYDLELWTKAIIHGKKFANLQDCLIYYRWHSQSMTQRLKFQQICAYNKIMHTFLREYKHGTI